MVSTTTQVINVIQNVGFPIAAFLLMWFAYFKGLKENTKVIRNLSHAIYDLKSLIILIKGGK